MSGAVASSASMVPPDHTTAAAESKTSSGAPSVNSQNGGKQEVDKDKTGKKRRFFGLGKKREDIDAMEKQAEIPAGSPSATTSPKPVAIRAMSPHRPGPADARHPASPPGTFAAIASSPSRIRSSSPKLHSPASSLIFERNVQENPLPEDVAHSIPSHIQTEDHIPPVLEASSKAITDDHLNPDEVEIVMHAAHQPAAVTVTGVNLSDSGAFSLHGDDGVPNGMFFSEIDDNGSNYGAIDTSDVRRLSFISFADVVQAEHVEHSRDAAQQPSLHSGAGRSPSPPVRSPASSHGFAPSPPTSGAPSVKGFDPTKPQPRAGTHSPPLASGGDLVVETMRQALRKTNSGDLSAARSQPLSAVSIDDLHPDHPPFKP